ncbi:MAG: enoyl-CoA hydratase-related protein [SAR324 cluster bacterium]|nr:enoyl-CoA hydratase-related protein [SAR324 cluster bacterium]
MTYQFIDVVCTNDVMEVSVQRPEVLNALNIQAHAELADAFDKFANDSALNMALIRGSGERAFCVGSDLKERAQVGSDHMPPSGFAGLTERFDLDKPVIALVNGDAIGGGLEIILACDLAIAVDTARFGLPEPKVGLAASGGLHRLARQLPLKRAMEISLKGQLFGAVEAKELGLINEIVPRQSLEDMKKRYLSDLKECSPLALRATKQMVLQGLDHGSLENAFKAHYHCFQQMLASEDAKEGVQAFSEKRKPVWKCR